MPLYMGYLFENTETDDSFYLVLKLCFLIVLLRNSVTNETVRI